MTADNATRITTAADDQQDAGAPTELVCSEIWGGNRPISQPFALPGIRGQVFSQPCEGGRGGDVHFISICSSGLLSRFGVADVAGHGAKVALVSDTLHRLLRRYMNTLDERRVLSALNQKLAASDRSIMTTAVAISYLPPLRRLTVSYAGHPPVWLYRRATGTWSPLEPESAADRRRVAIDLPLAIDPETTFSRRRRRVETGDRLLVLTDGAVEAPDANGELFGTDGLAEVLARHAEDSPDALIQAILSAVIAHTGDGGLRHDDLTLIVAEFVPGPRAFGLWNLIQNRFLRGALNPPRRPSRVTAHPV
jgi:sigma-B regulation protein RsbU (phosphoserine phosphatase)